MRSKNSPNGQERPPAGQDTRSFIQRARREQLIECAIECLNERGFTGTSVASVAARASLAKSALLYHFPSKEALLEAVVDHVYTSAAAYLEPVLIGADDERTLLASYLRGCCRFAAGHRHETTALTEVFANLRRDDGTLRFGPDENAPMLEYVEGILRAGQRSGIFGEFDPTSMAITIRSIIDGLPGVLRADPDLDTQSHTEHLVQLFDRATAPAVPSS